MAQQPFPNDQSVSALNILLRGEDVARILNISRALAYQLLQRGEIPAVRIGRAVRVRPADLEAFITRSTNSIRESFPQ